MQYHYCFVQLDHSFSSCIILKRDPQMIHNCVVTVYNFFALHRRFAVHLFVNGNLLLRLSLVYSLDNLSAPGSGLFFLPI